MTRGHLTTAAIAALVVCQACQFRARSVEEYRKDTRALLETRRKEVQNCYDDALAMNPNATGTVVVRFAVRRSTGIVTDAEILPESTAPAPVPECIRMALYGLTFEPHDDRDGVATFVWSFGPG